MQVTADEFEEFLRKNEGEEFETEGTEFLYSLGKPRQNEFSCSIHFSSPQWSESTKRQASARKIARFLDKFNDNPNLDWREYRNRNGSGSPATVAKYLVPLLQKACR
jgi:hypothetical protein